MISTLDSGASSRLPGEMVSDELYRHKKREAKEEPGEAAQ